MFSAFNLQVHRSTSERNSGFQEESRMCQLDPIASLRHTRIAVSSLFFVTTVLIPGWVADSATLVSWASTAS